MLFAQGLLHFGHSGAKLPGIKAEKDRSGVPPLPVGKPYGKTFLNHGGMLMKKRILSCLMALALSLSLLPTAALAEDATAMPKYNGGSGTKDDPWLISTVEYLKTLAETINSGAAAAYDAESDGAGNYHGFYFKQTADLELSSITNWVPIGYSLDEGYYFAGQYDGDGYTIANATSNGQRDSEGYATAGIFGWVLLGSVENLRVDRTNFTATGVNNGGWGGYSYAGGIAAGAFVATIKNCTVTNSDITSERFDKNGNADQNNCAGGVVGYSAGTQFVNCASISNRITSQCYGGGFVGENDDDNEIEENTPIAPSIYTNCFVANCSVNATTPDSRGWSFAGSFIGMLGDQNLALTNCYAYKTHLATKGTSACIVDTGVFVGHFYTNGSTYMASIQTENCYYGECGITNNAGTAIEKTDKEFKNGTVASALGDAFTQGKLYPVFTTDPADYTEVDAAIAKANALNKDNYKDFSAVEAAVNAVVRNKNITEQSDVNAMAAAIKNAITALQYKDADYTKVDEAIAKAEALNKSDYTNFTAVDNAVKAVDRDKKITEQTEVDAMAKTIEDAIAALVKKPSSGGGSSSSGSSSPSYPVTTPSKTENGTVTVSPRSAEKGDTVTITAKPDSGYQLDDLTVIDKNGKELKLTDKGNGKYTFTMPASKVEINAAFVKEVETSPFSDVSTSAYYYEAVKWAQEKGITGGIGNGLFGPNRPCTRAQIVTFLWRAAGSPVVNYAMNMTDVAEDAYYAEAVRWALSEGITTGTGDGKFSPDATCTRAQSVTFLFRAIGKLVDSKAEFSDVLADSYYANAVDWAVETGVTNGIGDGLFGPNNSCTRAQIVTFLWRAYSK